MNANAALPPLSPAEQTLMDLIWRLQPVAVSDLLESVNRNRIEPIIRNTLQTQLSRMEQKGWLMRVDGHKTRRYQSTQPEESGRAKLLGEMTDRVFGGCGVSMVRCLVEHGGLSDRQIEEIARIIRLHQSPKIR